MMEDMNILITNEAKRELDKLLENSDKRCIRILTKPITMTSDAKVDLELDEPTVNDNLYDVFFILTYIISIKKYQN